MNIQSLSHENVLYVYIYIYTYTLEIYGVGLMFWQFVTLRSWATESCLVGHVMFGLDNHGFNGFGANLGALQSVQSIMSPGAT